MLLDINDLLTWWHNREQQSMCNSRLTLQMANICFTKIYNLDVIFITSTLDKHTCK